MWRCDACGTHAREADARCPSCDRPRAGWLRGPLPPVAYALAALFLLWLAYVLGLAWIAHR